MSERDIVLLNGMPGSGKSRLGRTVAESLTPYFSAEHISVGDRVRAIGRGAVASSFSRPVIDHLNQPHNELPLDDEVINGVIREMFASYEAARLVLLDGYPRYISQVDDTFALAADSGRYLSGLIIAHIDTETAKSRLIRRGKKDTARRSDEQLASWRVEHYQQTFPATEKELGKRGLIITHVETNGDKDATTEIGVSIVNTLLKGPSIQTAS